MLRLLPWRRRASSGESGLRVSRRCAHGSRELEEVEPREKAGSPLPHGRGGPKPRLETRRRRHGPSAHAGSSVRP